MTEQQFYSTFKPPLRAAIWKKYPYGHIRQYWADNPKLYSQAFGHAGDDYRERVCGHSGIDVSTYHRDSVLASHAGVVYRITTSRTNIGGLVVNLRSDPFESLRGNLVCETSYAHLDEITVSVGQKVAAGEVIGYEGNTGFVISGGTPYWGDAPAGVGTHLHFGVREIDNDTKQYATKNCLGSSRDPLPLVTFNDPDYSGTSILLTNLSDYLKYVLRNLSH